MSGNTINVQGSYIDIHDNENVYLSVDKAKVSVGENQDYSQNEEELIKDLVRDCQAFFWGNASYAVLYCLVRDCCNYSGSVSQFEKFVEDVEYDFERNYSCMPGTIANAFRNNPYMYMEIEKWKQNGAKERVLRLLAEMKKRLST